MSLIILLSATVQASKYGRGAYGECLYGGCSIALATSGTVELSATPTTDGVYTINNDEVTVTTNSPDGYTLSISSNSNDADSRSLIGPAPFKLDPVSGTTSAPAVLGVNQWGVRVDGQGSFGPGPTAPLTNSSSSTLTFAGMPLLAAPTVIKETNTSALTGDTTNVWYGVHVNTDNPAGAYTQTVLYTAVTI